MGVAVLCAPSFFYEFAARLPTVLIEMPNSNAIIFCVMPRARRSSVAHSRAVSGRGYDFGDRLTSVAPRGGSGDAISGLSRTCLRAESALPRVDRENDGTHSPVLIAR